MPEGNSSICFVIAPIGEPDTEIRKRSDQVLKHIIQPSVKVCGYEATRADHIVEQGIITSQIIQHIIEDPMVVADLTGKNANIFYELAIRHALRKPYVQIIQRGEKIPFDVAGVRTIEVDLHDLDSFDAAKEEIIKQIKSIQSNEYVVDSPISIAVDLEGLRRSDVPEQRQLADVIAAITDLKSGLSSVEKRLSDPSAILPVSYLSESLQRIVSRMNIDMSGSISKGTRGERNLSIVAEILREAINIVEKLRVYSGPHETMDKEQFNLELDLISRLRKLLRDALTVVYEGLEFQEKDPSVKYYLHPDTFTGTKADYPRYLKER